MFLEDRGAATLAVTGPGAGDFLAASAGRFLPHLRIAGSAGPSKVALLADKFVADRTLAWRCEAGTCGLPSEDWRALLEAETAAWRVA